MHGATIKILVRHSFFDFFFWQRLKNCFSEKKASNKYELMLMHYPLQN